MQDVMLHGRTAERPPARSRRGNGSRDQTVQALVRAVAILDAFRGEPARSVTELAQTLRMHKSTVHRLLATLAGLGYVVQDPVTERYSLGLKVLDLAASMAPTIDVRGRALPVMQRLAATAQETVHLGILVDGEVACIESVASDRPLAVMRLVGKHGPVHVSSMGKVLLAHQPATIVEQVLARRGLLRCTPHSIIDRQAFLEELARVRQRGWAANLEEEELGLGCVAAPIRDHAGAVVAAVSIAAPTIRLQGAQLDQQVRSVVAVAKEISGALGYREAVASVGAGGQETGGNG
ncbi:MAG: IclR family transcriptional regulator [Chloroflexi bacterium]|nr:IclR family transcriptional regulator [Chloroflexota bacterium]